MNTRRLLIAWMMLAGAIGSGRVYAQRLFAAPLAPPEPERYFVLFFTAQDTIKTPRETHTWALIVRSSGGRIANAHSISWMPSDLNIKTWHLRVEPGTNLSLADSIGWTLSRPGRRISLWGPFETSSSLYVRFVARKAQLESGAIGYQCLDFLGEAAVRRNGVNCVHALAPIQGPMSGDVVQPYGDASGRYFTVNLRRQGVIGPYDPTNDWLLPVLGLDRVPLDRSGNAAASSPPVPRPDAAAVN